MAQEARIDKWLWAVRLFKTRTAAAEACKKGRIMIAGTSLKPSKMIKAEDIIQVRKPPITYSFRVLQPIEKRVSAALAAECRLDVTPADQLQLLQATQSTGFIDRNKGLGRPTKKDRRELETFTDFATPDYDFDE